MYFFSLVLTLKFYTHVTYIIYNIFYYLLIPEETLRSYVFFIYTNKLRPLIEKLNNSRSHKLKNTINLAQ